MKKALITLLLVGLICSVLAPASFAATFSDVPDNKWYSEGIAYCSGKGLIKGYSDGTFRPNNSITRAELAAICSTGLNLSVQETNHFTDVNSNAWYAPYVLRCTKAGIITGYSTEKFGPNDKVTREQAAVIAVKAYNLGKTSGNTSFADNSKISSWALSSVKTLTACGLAAGKGNNRFCPKDPVTRAEVAVVINSANKRGYKASAATKKYCGVKSDGKTCYGRFTSDSSNTKHVFHFKATSNAVYGLRLTRMDTWTNYCTLDVYDSKGVRIDNGYLGTYYNVAYGSFGISCKKGETYQIVIGGYKDNYYEFIIDTSNPPTSMELGYTYSNTLRFNGQTDILTFVAPANKRYGFRFSVDDPDAWATLTCSDSKGHVLFSHVVENSGTVSTTFSDDTFTAGETYTLSIEYGLYNSATTYKVYATENPF